MELPQARRESTKPSIATIAAIPQLLTPEEPVADSFARTKSAGSRVPVQTASPPASPEFRPFPSTENAFPQNDPVLYPESKNEQTPSPDQPLFATHLNQWPSRHGADSPASGVGPSPSTPPPANRPTVHRGEPPDAPGDPERPSGPERPPHAHVVGPVALLNHYGLDYYTFCLAQNEDHHRRRMEKRKLPPPSVTPAAHRDPYTHKVVQSLGHARTEKPARAAPATVMAQAVRAAWATTPPSDASLLASPGESPAKRHRRHPPTPDAAAAGVPHASQPRTRTRAAPTKQVNGKDLDWRKITDYAPPTSTLDHDPRRKLQAQWHNGNHLSVDHEPDKDALHPQELEVASVLRLKPVQYLMSKRRIFEARVAHLKENKDFNKTSAQACTSIDVNKASRLWDAFHGVGWFDERWFQRFVE